MNLSFLRSKTPLLDASQNSVAVILFVIWPFAQLFVPRASPLFLALAVVFAIALGFLSRVRGEAQPPGGSIPDIRLRDPVIIIFSMFLVLMALSIFWSPLPGRGAKDIAILLGAFLGAQFLAHKLRKVTLWPLANFVILALIICAIGLILENWRLTRLFDLFLDSNYLLDLNRNAAWLVVIGCAALGFIDGGKVPKAGAFIVGLLVAFGIWSSQGEAAKLALIFAILAGLTARFAPVLIKPQFVVFAAIFLTMPLIVGQLTDTKGRSLIPAPKQAHAGHRLAIWQGYAQLVGQKAMIGWGAKADRALGESGAAAKISAQRGFPAKTTSPHNVSLEIWVNQGFLGALLAAALLGVMGWKLAVLETWPRISGAAMVTAIFTVSVTGSSFYQGWWIATIAVGFVIWKCAARRVE